MKLNGKTAIVTGSTMGIGKAIAYHLAKNGANVVLNGRNEERLFSTIDALKGLGYTATGFQGDVTDGETCKKLINHAVEQFGSVDILVNNLGIGSRGFIEETNPEVFKYIIHSNILGSVYPTLEAMPHLKQNSGSIVFISSLAGFRGMPNAAPYSMSKRALVSFAESLRTETAKDNVHVGIVYVGATKNDVNKKVINAKGAWVPLQQHNGLFFDKPDDTALAVLDMIQHRSNQKVMGLQGKVYYWLQWLMPWFVEFTFKHNIETIMKAQS